MSINPKFKLFKIQTSTQQAQKQSGSDDYDDDARPSKQNHVKSKRSKGGQKQKRDIFEATSSILSDYDELEIIDDDQSSYVLFNPKTGSSKNEEDDILSLTNTSRAADSKVSDNEDEEEDYDDDHDEEELQENRNEEDDDGMQTDTEVYGRLSNKINSWYNSNILKSTRSALDENVASWNLDEEDVMEEEQEEEEEEIQNESSYILSSSSATAAAAATENSQQSLDESKKLLTEFYGDDLFKYLDQDDIAQVKKFHKYIDIKNYLLSKDHRPGSVEITNSPLLKQLIYKLLLINNQTSTNENQGYLPPYQQPINMGGTDYINYLTKDVRHYDHLQHAIEPATFSETTGGGSSLIMCGGVGFGSNATWNDI
ncbi:uncharacterized protein LODBEIA_P26860 [Lodderomyces beijingensis]|uniref:Uncharacterized protein n=1 Tax=Lodderomyces beijingensis TaxID=1775926 RepID=A0ABP0ZQI2_9ASCO